MTTITIATSYNAAGKCDATGAFLPESAAFSRLHGGRNVTLEKQGAAARRSATEAALATAPGLEILAVFGHGTVTRLIATGHTLRQVDNLAAAIAAASGPNLSVILYACSTGHGKIGFADRLADRLADMVPLAHVWAHSTAGHTSWNPYVELAGGPNGGDPVARPGELLWKRWRTRLRDDQAFRLSFWRCAHGLTREAALDAVRGLT